MANDNFNLTMLNLEKIGRQVENIFYLMDRIEESQKNLAEILRYLDYYYPEY